MNGIISLTGASRVSAILSEYSKAIDSSLEKLSTGLRVNSPSDDLNSYFRAQDLEYRTSTAKSVAAEMEDHVSRLSTAEDAMTNIRDLLEQMSDLAKEASTETSASVRTSLGTEYDKLRDSITTIVNTTRYDGELLLSGALDSGAGGTGITVQVGEEVTDTFTYSILDTRTTQATGLNLSASNAATLWADAGTGQAAASTAYESIVNEDSGIHRLDRNLSRISTNTTVISGAQTSMENRASNYEAARSALVGVDDAEESSTLTGLQIRQQAAASFLAQSNVSRSSVISYLAGMN